MNTMYAIFSKCTNGGKTERDNIQHISTTRSSTGKNHLNLKQEIREGCRDKLQLCRQPHTQCARLRKSRDVPLLANAVIGVGTNPHPSCIYKEK